MDPAATPWWSIASTLAITLATLAVIIVSSLLIGVGGHLVACLGFVLLPLTAVYGLVKASQGDQTAGRAPGEHH